MPDVMKEQEIRRLPQLELLRGVALESISGLLRGCPVVRLRRGAELLARGQSNTTMYLLLEGTLSVHLDGGESDPVAVLEAGTSVGELSVIDDSSASADVLAASPATLLAVDEETFWRLVRASHEFAANLLVLLAQRMRATNTTAMRFDHASTVDGLTGLRNRRWLEEHLQRLIGRELRDGRPLSVAMVDLDHFKKFNDSRGHQAGDRALVAVARALEEQIRPLDFAARYGGEEMVLIFPGTALDGAVIAAERVRGAVAGLEIAMPDGDAARITLSAGVAEVGEDETAQQALSRADHALYRAKASGRDRVEAESRAGGFGDAGDSGAAR